MAEQQLVDYIKNARSAGQTDDQTRNLLLKNGWTPAEVSDAFASFSQPQTQSQPQMSQQPASMPKMETQTQSQPAMQPKPQPQPQQQPQSQSQVKPQAQVQPQAQPTMQAKPQTDMPRMRTGGGRLVKLFITLIILVAVIGGGYLVASQYLGLPNILNLFAPNPQVVITKMLTNMKNVKAAHTAVQAMIGATDSKKVSQWNSSLNINGDGDVTNINNPKANFTITSTIKPTSSVASTVLANASIIAVGNAFYAKLNDYDANLINYPQLNISKLQGNWLEIDRNSVKALSGVKIPNFSELDAQAQQAGFTPNTSLTQNIAFFQKIQELVTTENLFTFNKQLSDQVISGQNTYHYLLTIKQTKLKDVADKTLNLQLPAGSQNPMIASVNSAIDKIGDVDIELWIGKTDYLLYQTKIDKFIDLSKIYPGMTGQLEAKLVMTNSNLNKPVVVQAPSSQRIEDVVLPLIKTGGDIMQIGSLAGSLYGPNKGYSTLCFKGLLNGYSMYGKELIALNNDIVAQGLKKPSCFSSAADYCVSAQLADGSFMCIGKNGVLGQTQCTSATTACK